MYLEQFYFYLMTILTNIRLQILINSVNKDFFSNWWSLGHILPGLVFSYKSLIAFYMLTHFYSKIRHPSYWSSIQIERELWKLQQLEKSNRNATFFFRFAYYVESDISNFLLLCVNICSICLLLLLMMTELSQVDK